MTIELRASVNFTHTDNFAWNYKFMHKVKFLRGDEFYRLV